MAMVIGVSNDTVADVVRDLAPGLRIGDEGVSIADEDFALLALKTCSFGIVIGERPLIVELEIVGFLVATVGDARAVLLLGGVGVVADFIPCLGAIAVF